MSQQRELFEFPLVVGTKESLKDYGLLITPKDVKGGLGIPFYTKTVLEGENIDGIRFHGPVVFRTSKIIPSKPYNEHTELLWLERHMRMTQGFVGLGNSPWLAILGKPTPNNNLPDMSNVKAFIVPPGHVLFLHIGTWHDFPIAIKPFEITLLLLNSKEVVDALASMEKPGEMDFGDAYKLRLSKHFGQNKKFVVNNYDAQRLCFQHIISPLSNEYNQSQIDFKVEENARANLSPARLGQAGTGRSSVESVGATGQRRELLTDLDQRYYNKYSYYYGKDIIRKELMVSNSSSRSGLPLFVMPVINIELMVRGKGGPSIQSHLNTNKPELANSGWRDYGNRAGCLRLSNLFKELDINGTVVMNSDLINYEKGVIDIIKDTKQWEVGAHGVNNTKVDNHASMTYEDEKRLISQALNDISKEFGLTDGVSTWLTPGFAVTENTTNILMELGVKCILDYPNDDSAYMLCNARNNKDIISVPYSLETNDISLCLAKNYNEVEYGQCLKNHILEMSSYLNGSRVNVLCLGLHTFIAGVPSRVGQLRKVFQELKQNRNVRFVTCKEVVQTIRGQDNILASLKSVM